MEPLDYSRVENWVINANADLNTDFDLFFICGTAAMASIQENGVALMNEDARAMGYENFIICGS